MAVIERLSEEEAYLLAILTDKSGLDLAEFTWHEAENDDGCFRAWPFQWTWWRSTDPQQIDACARALDVATPIPTPSGWTTMGELWPGDKVFDEQGKSTTVLAVSEVWNDRPCFEVCFDDHTSIVADAEHLWLTWDKAARVARNPNRRGLPIPRVRTTADIAATLVVRGEQNHAIDVSGALSADEADLPLDPYYLGFWLGDGNTITSEITTADVWVLEELTRRGLGIVERKNYLHFGVAFPGVHNRKTESVQSRLRQVGVLGHKHIPITYLRASERQRRDLLAGLVDSDGHMQSNGSCEVTQKAFPVAAGLMELLRSLGEKPRMIKRIAYLNGVDCGPVYRVSWRPRVNPALLPRKAAAFIAPQRKAIALGQRRVIQVRPVATRPLRCITVDSPSHLFLAGEGMVPTHNSVGKSLSIRVRGFAFPFLHPGEEMVVTAPELVHLEPIVNLIENQFYTTRLGREMMQKGRSAVTHRPFMMNFANSARIIGRIPQRDGRGVKGIHPIWLEMDEAQDYPRAGWIELSETLKRGFEGAVWRAHGVTRGMRDKFFEYSQEGSGWIVHNFTAMHRPNFTAAERAAAIKRYSSRDDPDYRRNMLGAHGDVANRLFVLSRLMRCVDVDESSDYNLDDYYRFDVKDTEVEAQGIPIEELLEFPVRHQRYDTTWCGMDVGFTSDPSEILVFAEYHPDAAELKADKAMGRASPENGLSRVKVIARISLRRISHPDQVSVILRTIAFYQPRAFALDKTGNGLPLFQAVQAAMQETALRECSSLEEARQIAERIKGYNFSEKVVVEIDASVAVEDFDDHDKVAREAGMKRNVLEFSTDVLRDFVDNGRLFLPIADKEMLAEFSGQTFSFSKEPMDGYGRKRRVFSEGRFHALDAARMGVMALAQAPIETFLHQPKPPQQPVYDAFLVM